MLHLNEKDHVLLVQQVIFLWDFHSNLPRIFSALSLSLSLSVPGNFNLASSEVWNVEPERQHYYAGRDWRISIWPLVSHQRRASIKQQEENNRRDSRKHYWEKEDRGRHLRILWKLLFLKVLEWSNKINKVNIFFNSTLLYLRLVIEWFLSFIQQIWQFSCKPKWRHSSYIFFFIFDFFWSRLFQLISRKFRNDVNWITSTFLASEDFEWRSY